MKSTKTIKKTTKNRYLIDTSKKDILYFIPIITAIAVVPLIVYLKIVVLQGIQKDMWVGGDKVSDFFTYYKYVVLILAAVAGVFTLLIKKMNNNLLMKRSSIYIPLAIYAFFVFVSTILSQYKDVATAGFADRYEGVYALLAYVALAVITFNLVETEKNLKYIINSLLISSAILGLIGLSQYLGIDFFQTTFGKYLILPPEYQSSSGELNFRFTKNMVYATLYNPNYVGSYVVLLLPIFLGVFIYEKRALKKILIGLSISILLVCLLGSQSMAGFIGLVVAVVIFAIFFRYKIKKYLRYIVGIFVVLVILLIGVNLVTGGNINQYASILNKSSRPQAETDYIKDITLSNNTMKMVTNSQSLSIKLIDNTINFLSENNDIVTPKQDHNTITFVDPKYSMYKFSISDNGLIDCYIGKKTFQAAIVNENFKLVGIHGELIDVVHPNKIGFVQQESALTARGFIWSRTIPLLKDTIFIGHGPDTFPIYFPQDDIIGKLNAYNRTNVFVDKPHNLYLQMAMNTGVISMLSFVALLLMYAITSFKLYFKRNAVEYKDYIGISIFCAICGYSTSGLGNDSVVSVAPVFWVLLGLGIACNFIIYKGSESGNLKKVKHT